jgi:hypothetical protein
MAKHRKKDISVPTTPQELENLWSKIDALREAVIHNLSSNQVERYYQYLDTARKGEDNIKFGIPEGGTTEIYRRR